jgi:hypothetical protein
MSAGGDAQSAQQPGRAGAGYDSDAEGAREQSLLEPALARDAAGNVVTTKASRGRARGTRVKALHIEFGNRVDDLCRRGNQLVADFQAVDMPAGVLCFGVGPGQAAVDIEGRSYHKMAVYASMPDWVSKHSPLAQVINHLVLLLEMELAAKYRARQSLQVSTMSLRAATYSHCLPWS